ncbi:MAG: hypothetical protein NT003_00950 [Candidatus Magasanikbacteria bacterium]|nr:hypothetical protein [Candidatus Magasanikbacteria bacterium]
MVLSLETTPKGPGGVTYLAGDEMRNSPDQVEDSLSATLADLEKTLESLTALTGQLDTLSQDITEMKGAFHRFDQRVDALSQETAEMNLRLDRDGRRFRRIECEIEVVRYRNGHDRECGRLARVGTESDYYVTGIGGFGYF